MRNLSSVLAMGYLFAAAKDVPQASGDAAKPTETNTAPVAMPTDFAALGKMSIKAIGADPKDAIRQGKQIFIGRIFGEAQDMITKESRSGDPYSYFVGLFRAVNAKGEGFESPQLFLPGSIFDQIAATLKTAEGKSVSFGYDIYANEDKKSSIGYAYAARTIVKSAVSDRLAALTGQVSDVAVKTA